MGKIVTFYSYKGGVGRTMALANVAVLLTQYGYKVLVVDWDLEAPGLDFFFKDHFSNLSLEEAMQTEGVIDLLHGFLTGKRKSKTYAKPSYVTIEVTFPSSQEPLYFFTAGKRDGNFIEKLNDLNLETFYTKKEGGYFIEEIRKDWKELYDFVLIDSRTGITDIGGICTIQLPDILVLVFNTTEQSVRGTIEIAQRTKLARQKLPFDRLSLITLPIPSRFDTTEEFKASQEWLTRISTDFKDIFINWLPTSVDVRDFLEVVKVPYIPYFSFGEKLAVLEQGLADPTGLGYAYETIATLISNDLQNVEQLLSSRSEFVKASRRRVKITDVPLNFRQRLIEALASIKAFENYLYRDLLLLGFPKGPVGAIPRSASYYTDLTNFVDSMASWGKLESGENALVTLIENAQYHVEGTQQFTVLQSLKSELTSSNSPPLISNFVSKTQIPSFVDREDELRTLLRPDSRTYIGLHGSPGSGKTTLLINLQERFQMKKWLCAYVSVKAETTVDDLLFSLADELGIIPSKDSSLPRALRFGTELSRQWGIMINKGIEGLVLLIDFDGKSSYSILDDLVDSVLPAIADALRSLSFFAQGNRYRVILAGRNLARRLQYLSARLVLANVYLEPFNFDVIQDSLRRHIPFLSLEATQQLTAHILFLTGGHPGSIAKVIKMYMENQLPPDTFLQMMGEKVFNTIVRPTIQEILYEFHEDFIYKLSVYRYLDIFTLRLLVEDGIQSTVHDEFHIADLLINTSMFSRERRILRAGPTRQLLVIGLRNDSPDEFSSLSKRAQEICAEQVVDKRTPDPERWIIEYMFQVLQQYSFYTPNEQQEEHLHLRESFMNVAVPQALMSLVRNVPRKAWPEELAALNQTMDEDWEFRFMVNYCLRKDQYTDEPYTMLRKQINSFFYDTYIYND